MEFELYNAWMEEVNKKITDVYRNAKDDHLSIAKHEHICALGSTDNETATIHERSADIHRNFAKYMDDLIKEINNKE